MSSTLCKDYDWGAERMTVKRALGAAYAKQVDEATKRLEEALSLLQRDKQPSRLSQFPPRSLTWLALAPAWPRGVAERGFPLGDHGLATGEPVTKALTEIARARLCELGSSDDGSGQVFLMNASQRSATLNFLHTLSDDELQGLKVQGYIRARLEEAGETMAGAAAQPGLTVAQPLQRWAELAGSAGSDESISKVLRDRVEEALAEAEKCKQVISPEALRWIEAAAPFVELLGAPMEWAVAQSGRRLELFYRNAYDERFLKNYFIRTQQEQAFKELLNGADDLTARNETSGNANTYWALHYVGLGGTGKTMLMRRISAQLAGPMELAVARIDFDRLNPDYPSRAPGLLLMSFAEELRLHATKNTPDLFERFDKEVERLHGNIREAVDSNAPFTVSVGDPAFQLILMPFVDAVRRLSEQNKRIVLVLDTCEELAKIRSDGLLPDSVRVTFEILERIQGEVANLRVVFSGRRPLASAGHLLPVAPDKKEYKWTCPVSKLPERDYLRLHEIRGFTSDESLTFLKQYRGEGESKVNPALLDAIIRQSCSADKSFDSRFEWHDKDTETDTSPRYNPFDLDMFAEWACADPKVSEEDINKGATRYVQERIIKRADPGIKKLLPEVVLLGRFDEKMIRQLAETKRLNSNNLFTELISQEWVDIDRNATQAGTVWAMDNIMRKRLHKYYSSEESSALSKATAHVSELMTELTLQRDWQELSPAYFDATLRTLASYNKVKAVKWWEDVEKKLAAAAHWSWAKELTDQLLGDDGPAALADSTLGQNPEDECVLRPAVLATQAAAITHLLFSNQEVDRGALLSIWSEVLQKADRHPIREGALKLKHRAVAGKLAAYRWQAELHSPQLLNVFVGLLEDLPRGPEFQDESCAASEIAMLEALVEVSESLALEPVSAESPEFTSKLSTIYLKYYQKLPAWWSDSLPPDLWAFCTTLLARLQKLCRLHAEAAGTFFEGLEILKSENTGQPLQPRLDWHHPDDVPARVGLEFVRGMYPAYAAPDEILARVSKRVPIAERLVISDTIDADRLASAAMLLRGYSSISSDSDHSYQETLRRSLARQSNAPYCNAHRSFPVLFATVLENEFALGRVEKAVEQCQEISKQAENSKPPALHIQKAADRALMRMAARMRLRDERGAVVGGSLNESRLMSDLDLRAYLSALDGAKSNENLEEYFQSESDGQWRASLTHIGWRAGKSNIKHETLIALYKSSPSASFAEIALTLDYLEALHISKSGQTKSELTDDKLPSLISSCRLWSEAHATRPDEALTLYLRATALSPEKKIDIEFIYLLIRKVGKRRAAEIAFEEGTLLALKLPRLGAPLLEMAHGWYEECKDRLSQLLAATSVAVLCGCQQDKEGLSRWLSVMKDEYRDCAKVEQLLPSWETLAGVASEKQAALAAENVGRLMTSLEASRSWRPCLVRVLGCLIREQEFSAPQHNTRALQAWIESNYSATVEERSYIPPDLSYFFTYDNTTLAKKAKAATETPKPPSLTRSDVMEASVGLGIVIASFIGITYIVKWLASFFYQIPFWLATLITLALTGVSFLLPRIFKAYASALFSSVVRRFVVENLGEIKDINRPLLSPVALRFKFLGVDDVITLEAVGPGQDDSYRNLAQVLPPQTRKAWARTNGWMGKLYMRTKITVNDKNAAAPWEAIIGLPSEKIEKFEQSRMICWRSLKVRDVTELNPLTAPLEIMTLASDISQRDLAEKTWDLAITSKSSPPSAADKEKPGDLSADALVTFSVGRPSSALKGVLPNVGVLHLIGTPTQTSSGIRLEVTEAGDIYSNLSSPREHVTSGRGRRKMSIASFESENSSSLIRAEDIARCFPRQKICLVQSVAPGDESRSATQRYEAGLLRRFGAELFSCGIPAVILLPPLREDVSTKVIRELQRRILREAARGRRRWWQQKTQLAQTVRAMQELIGESYQNNETAVELAFDLCLYMVEEFDLNVNHH